MKPVKVNPLGYYCAPNAADASYACARSIDDFVAYGMLASHLSHHYINKSLRVVQADTRWLRHSFLNAVARAAGYWRQIRTGELSWKDAAPPRFIDDFHQDTVSLYPRGVKEEDVDRTDNVLHMDWHVWGLHRDCCMLTMDWWHEGSGQSGGDCIYLQPDCLNNRHHLLRALARGRIANELFVKPVDYRLVTTNA